ncbi:MAG: pyridoxamine 5'-phosphate oxidase family protein [Acidimicrobiales bacterium]
MADRVFADPAIQRYLAGKDVMILAMLTVSGGPLATPMWFVHDEEQLAMVSVDGLAKVRNLERDPRVSVVAEGGRRGAIDGVVLTGEVRFLDGDERLDWGRRFRDKYAPDIERLWGGPDLPDNRRVFALRPRVASAFGL